MHEDSTRATAAKFVNLIDVGCWVILAVCVLQLLTAVFGKIACPEQQIGKAPSFEHVDFINHYKAGTMLASADRNRVYDPAVQLEHYNRLISPDKVTELVFYLYPPYVFILATPLTLLKLKDSFLAFDALTTAAGLSGLLLLMRLNPNLPAKQRLVVLIASLGCFPSLDCLRDGQLAWLFVALFSFYFWAFVRKKDLLAGITLGITAIKPHYFLFLLLSAIIAKRIKLSVTATTVLLFLIVLSGLLLGWENVLAYPSILRREEAGKNFVCSERMISIRGTSSLFLPHDPALALGSLCGLAGIAAAIYIWHCAIVRKLFSARWAMALTCVILLIASPHTLVYDAVLLSVSAALTLPTARITQALKAAEPSLRIWNALLIFYPALSWLLMIFVPIAMRACFSGKFQSIFSVNGANYGLASFPCFLLLHLAILAAGSVYVFSGGNRAQATT